MIAFQIAFFLSAAAVAYAYLGYPLIVRILARFLGSEPRRSQLTPKVSVIIAAYNEEAAIARKIENTLSLDYPKDQLEVIVASDCSTDGTDQIVRTFADRGVILYRQPERLGKSVA